MIGSCLRLAVVALAAGVNVLGTSVVGIGMVAFMFLVSPPLLALVLASYAAPHTAPLAPFTPSLQEPWWCRPQRYRPLSDREQEMQRAEGQLHGCEMSRRDREEWDAARDRGDEEDEDEAGGGRGTDEGAPSPELPLTYDSTYEHDDSPRESPKGTAPPTSSRAGAVAGATKRAAAKRVTISADEVLAQCRSSRAAAPAPGADVPAASGISSGAGEVSASEAARMLAAEREKGTTSGGRVATASADEFVDIIE